MRTLLFLAIGACGAVRGAAPGWVHEGPHISFRVSHDGAALSTEGRGHTPNWIRTARPYADFHLRFEYRLAQWAEAAVYLRAPRSDRPAGAGVAIVLAHDFHHQRSFHVTGAVRNRFQPASLLPPSYGDWHAAEIHYQGEQLRVVIDGILLQDQRVESRLPGGYLGFADLGHAYEARRIAVEDLGGPARWIPLEESAGWERRGASGSWRWDQEVLTGANGHSIYYSPGEFANFVFSALVRTRNRANAGVFFRGSPHAGHDRGFEVQIYSPPEAVYPTGSIYGHVRSTLEEDLEARWFLLQVRAEGPRCRVWIDGREVAASSSLPAGRGRIGFQIHQQFGAVEFRDLRVQVLE